MPSSRDTLSNKAGALERAHPLPAALLPNPHSSIPKHSMPLVAADAILHVLAPSLRRSCTSPCVRGSHVAQFLWPDFAAQLVLTEEGSWINDKHTVRNAMRKKLAIIAAIAALAAIGALAGCSSAPSDAEVREAIRGRLLTFSQAFSPDKPLSDREAKELDAEVAKIKVIGCKQADQKNGFNCDWTGGDSMLLVGNSGRIVKGDAGWVLMKAGE